jgi:phosphate transport system ATP-binding protein
VVGQEGAAGTARSLDATRDWLERNLHSTSIIETERFSFFYGKDQALRDVSLGIPVDGVTAIMGPSGCGKSTLLRAFNRMNELYPNTRAEGTIRFLGQDLLKADAVAVRRHIGMVFQRPNPFPKSIFDNVAYGPRVHGIRNRPHLAELVEESLRRAALWDEVKDHMKKSALSLSGGQQQRLCIARALAVRPTVLLMDEPCSALDPKATDRIETTTRELAQELTVVIVTHNLQQAGRISDHVAVLLAEGVLAEFGPTRAVFESPTNEQVADYLSGRFG